MFSVNVSTFEHNHFFLFRFSNDKFIIYWWNPFIELNISNISQHSKINSYKFLYHPIIPVRVSLLKFPIVQGMDSILTRNDVWYKPRYRNFIQNPEDSLKVKLILIQIVL